MVSNPQMVNALSKVKTTLTPFVQTEAYSDLFMELATNADAAAAFVNGIVPQQNNFGRS